LRDDSKQERDYAIAFAGIGRFDEKFNAPSG
jgi:hypothetical protein